MKIPKVFLFDLDGTLVDTVEAIIDSTNTARVNAGYVARDRNELFMLVGLDPQSFFGDLCLPSHSVEKLVVNFREELGKVEFSENDIYPGVIETLEFLTRNEIPIAIASNKPTNNAIKLLRKVGISEYFVLVQGSEPELRSKPEGDILNECIRKIGCHDAIMVGDRVEDVLAAKQSALISVGIGQT